MSHVRQQIREAAATTLTGLATTGARVFQSRLRPLRDIDLPCLLITTGDEQIETVGISPHPMLERQLALKVRAVAKDTTDLDDALDQMLAEIETALDGATFNGRADSIALTGIAIEMSDELEQPVGVATATYQVTYYTAAGSPGTAL